MNIKIFLCCAVFASVSSAENIETVLKRNQKAAKPVFPVANTATFSALQKEALQGDPVAQEKLPSMMLQHLQSVYKILDKQTGLLFSVRQLDAGYDKANNNYAINIDEFFKATADEISVKKDGIALHTKDGASWPVKYLTYRPSEKAIEVKDASGTHWVPLAELVDVDRRFVESALADEIFESGGQFEIFTEDSRSGAAKLGTKDKVSRVHEETGEKVEGAYVSTASKGIDRKIILVNSGSLSLKNLTVEYQSFADQTIMKMPKDFPSDYRCVGFVAVKSLDPGERKEIELTLPEIIEAKQQTITTGDYEYYRTIPSDCNQRSESRMNGIRVRVCRFTPYGERLTREYESAGTPSVEWNNVAFSGLDIRK